MAGSAAPGPGLMSDLEIIIIAVGILVIPEKYLGSHFLKAMQLR